MKSEPATKPRPLPEQLRCPMTKGRLELKPDGLWVRVVGQALRYPVRGGIPVLVASAADKTG